MFQSARGESSTALDFALDFGALDFGQARKTSRFVFRRDAG
jgi:hypothetical protein